MDFLGNIELISVGIAITSIAILGFTVYFSEERNSTNLAFLFFALLTIAYNILNFLIYQIPDPALGIWVLRATVFIAVWHAFSVFTFFYIFPQKEFNFPTWFKKILLPIVLAVSSLNLTPLVFKEILPATEANILNAVNGPLVPVFGMAVMGLIGASFIILFRKLFRASGESRSQYFYITLGSVITFSLILIFNFVFPTILNDSSFIRLGALFFFPFVALTTYAIVKHHLLNIKVIGAEVLIFVISILTLMQVLISETTGELLYSVVLFSLILIFGISLIKSVIKEVKQREQIEVLATNLQKANERLKELDRLKSEFVSIASHQLRSPLTAMKGYASLILEGSFGEVSGSVREAVQKIFDSSNLMAVSVQDFLDVSRIEQGKMKYNFEEFDLKKLIETVVEEQVNVAREKGLQLNLNVEEENSYKVNADLGKIKQVLYNLVDNSIKYTPKGSVSVKMSKSDDKSEINIEIEDTGVGISAEALPKLFAKFVRTRNAHNVNVSGTGLGLFVVKEMVKAHGGKVWVTSPGEGKGSTFHVLLKAI